MSTPQAEPGRPPAEAPIIELRGVTKVYGEGALAFQALKGVDLRIAQGDFVAIMGPSGSGKSTAMNTLGCLDRPTTGEYLFKGVHVEALSRDERALLRRRYFGFVFQGFNLLARTSAQENVELPLLYRGESAAKRKAAAARALDAVGLKGWEHHTPAELSGGQQQRVAIARAIVTEPVVLLADEPTGNLDTQRSHEIMELLWRLNAEQGITVLMVTHEPDMAEYARRMVRFVDGVVDSDTLNPHPVGLRGKPAPVVAEPVRTAADVARLSFGKADDHLGYVYDAVTACKKELADRVPLIGFCGAPFTTASYMIEGSGSKDFLHTKKMAFTEPAMFGRLLESITTVLVDYLAGQVRAGVDALQIFESWGAAMTPEDYALHVKPHVARLVTEARGHGVPVILFVRGNASLLEQIKDLGADVLGVDWSIELSRAIDVVGTDKVVQGNLDPIALFAPPEQLKRRATAIVEAGRRAKAHIFNLGHGISRYTDPDAVARLVDAVHAA